MNRLLLLFILFAGCTSDYNEPERLVEDFAERSADRQTVSYHADYYVKYLSEDDTLHFPVDVKLVRFQQDSIFGGMVYYQVKTEESNFSNLYDLDTIYNVDVVKNTVTTFRPHLGEDWIIRGNSAGSAIETYFFNYEKLSGLVRDSLNKVSVRQESDGRFHLTVIEPDEEPFYDQERHFWFTSDGLTLNEFTSEVGFQGNMQFKKWVLSEIEYDSFGSDEIITLRDSITESNLVSAYVPKNPADQRLLETGSNAPLIAGELWKSGQRWKLEEQLGKPVILDFWYMSCMPCIQAIPHLNEIYKKYGNSVEVIGVNSIDNDEKGLERLPEFVEENELSYHILLAGRSADSLYRVSGYPSLYIIDPSGRITYAQPGFYEAMNDTIETVLDGFYN